MSLSQHLLLKQQLRLTPQQLLLQRLLPLSTFALEEKIKNELEENPALEIDNEEDEIKEPVTEQNENPSIDKDFWQDDGEEDIGDYMPEVGEVKQFEVKSENTSFDLLNEQLYTLNLNTEEQKIAQQIIGSLDHHGYLSRSLQALSDDMLFTYNKDFSEKEILSVLQKVQQLEPVGIACRNLQECLWLQLKKQQEEGFKVDLAIQIVEKYFHELSNKIFTKIQQALQINHLDLETALEQIEQLHPYPINESTNLTKTTVYPDFIITQKDDKIDFFPTKTYIPKLRINKEYEKIIERYKVKKEKEAELFIKQKIEHAQFFIQAIQQRYHTIEEIITIIIQLQKDYFLTGDEAQMQPMLLKDIAQKTHKDIATISRAIQHKYVQTDWGIKPLKYFFNEQINNKQGTSFIGIEIQNLLQQIIDNEDKQAPFTDEALEKELSKMGKKIPRRSITNYREKMNIPVARLRKKL